MKRILDENANVRYTFVISHGGLFPFDSWKCRWCYLGGVNNSHAKTAVDPACDVLRREMRAVFARRNALVLCGHTHHLELKEAVFREGTITEMTMNSVPFKSKGGEVPAIPEVVREGPENYGNVDWVKGDSSYAALFGEYRPFMRRYFLANAAGHAKLRVSDEGVWFDYYGREARTLTMTFKLR